MRAFLDCRALSKASSGGGANFGLAKGDVKGRDGGAVGAQCIEEVGEVGAREGPVAEDFLRMLIDINDGDDGIDGRGAGRAVAEACVQGVVLEALEGREDGSGAFAEKSDVIERERDESDDQADEERDAMFPPAFKQFDEREDSAHEPVFDW